MTASCDFSDLGNVAMEKVNGQRVVCFMPNGRDTAERDANLLKMDRRLTAWSEERGWTRGILLTQTTRYPVPCVIVQVPWEVNA